MNKIKNFLLELGLEDLNEKNLNELISWINDYGYDYEIISDNLVKEIDLQDNGVEDSMTPIVFLELWLDRLNDRIQVYLENNGDSISYIEDLKNLISQLRLILIIKKEGK